MNEYYHAKKGCELIPHIKIINRRYNVMCKYCKTHKVIVCNCGWEFQHHHENNHTGIQ